LVFIADYKNAHIKANQGTFESQVETESSDTEKKKSRARRKKLIMNITDLEDETDQPLDVMARPHSSTPNNQKSAKLDALQLPPRFPLSMLTSYFSPTSTDEATKMIQPQSSFEHLENLRPSPNNMPSGVPPIQSPPSIIQEVPSSESVLVSIPTTPSCSNSSMSSGRFLPTPTTRGQFHSTSMSSGSYTYTSEKEAQLTAKRK
jgi:hypothetical protein